MQSNIKKKTIKSGGMGKGEKAKAKNTEETTGGTGEGLAAIAGEQGGRVVSTPYLCEVASYGGETSLQVMARGAGAAVFTLAKAGAASFVRKWEAGSCMESRTEKDASGKPLLKWRAGRAIESSDSDELQGIYHLHFARAFVASGIVPASWEGLWVRRGNLLSFSALRVWVKACHVASSAARSYLYGHGAEQYVQAVVPLATASDLQELAALWNDGANCKGSAEDVEPQGAEDGADVDGVSIRTRWNGAGVVLNRERTRRFASHALWCLRAYWMAGASRKWRAGFESDYALLRAAAMVARGSGIEVLQAGGMAELLNDSWSVKYDRERDYFDDLADRQTVRSGGKRGANGGGNKRLYDRLAELRLHIASGDILLTDEAGRVAGLLIVHLGAKFGGRAARSLVARSYSLHRAGVPSLADESKAARFLSALEREAAREAGRGGVVVIEGGEGVCGASAFRGAWVRCECLLPAGGAGAYVFQAGARGVAVHPAARGGAVMLEYIQRGAARGRLASVAIAEAVASEESRIEAARRGIAERLERMESQLDAMAARRLAFDASMAREDCAAWMAGEALGLPDKLAAGRVSRIYLAKAKAEREARRGLFVVREQTKREADHALNGREKPEGFTIAEMRDAARMVSRAIQAESLSADEIAQQEAEAARHRDAFQAAREAAREAKAAREERLFSAARSGVN